MSSVPSARLTPLTLNTRLMSDQWPPPVSKPGSLRDTVTAFENKRSTSASQGPPVSPLELVSLQRKPTPPSPPVAWDNVQSGGCETQSTRGTYAADATESIGRSGSLRERMAALQGKGAFGSAPPPITPKPAMPSDNLQSCEGECKPQCGGGMSAANAAESIGRGGSLKERMAAPQGKGAFGGPPSPIAPNPSIGRPKRGRLPSVPAPVTCWDESKEATRGVDASGREAPRSPPPRAAARLSPECQGTANHEEISLVQGDGGDHGSEEEERQHKAMIAVHVSRLGGANVGTGPPIVAPRPVICESSPLPEVKEEALVDQPTILEESNQGTTYRR